MYSTLSACVPGVVVFRYRKVFISGQQKLGLSTALGRSYNIYIPNLACALTLQAPHTSPPSLSWRYTAHTDVFAAVDCLPNHNSVGAKERFILRLAGISRLLHTHTHTQIERTPRHRLFPRRINSIQRVTTQPEKTKFPGSARTKAAFIAVHDSVHLRP